eukprot:SAG25_NODE_207_length_11874_cov_27.396773_6_plen_71_part_00
MCAAVVVCAEPRPPGRESSRAAPRLPPGPSHIGRRLLRCCGGCWGPAAAAVLLLAAAASCMRCVRRSSWQ